AWVQRAWVEVSESRLRSVLYRGGKRHVCQAQELKLDAGRLPIRRGGTYLITGGAGGLGLQFAQHLAKKHAANVVLTGRSALNEARRGKLQELEAFGAGVMYVQADVGDLDAMRGVMRQISARFGVVDGL